MCTISLIELNNYYNQIVDKYQFDTIYIQVLKYITVN